jgi:hypothetical protein
VIGPLRAEEVPPKISFYGRLHVIADRATLDVPRELAQFTACLLAAERRRRPGERGHLPGLIPLTRGSGPLLRSSTSGYQREEAV